MSKTDFYVFKTAQIFMINRLFILKSTYKL